MELRLVNTRRVNKKMRIELVVAIYREKIFWLDKVDKNIKIKAYAKYMRFDFDFEDYLENIGRESQTYCYHIIKNYQNLADFTIFSQGDPFVHLKNEFDNPYVELFSGNHLYVNDFYPLDGLSICNQKGAPFSSWEINLGEIWDELFLSVCPDNFIAIYGAQFIVSKELIRMRSYEFWVYLNELHKKYVHLPYALEIMWFYIFDPRFKTKF